MGDIFRKAGWKVRTRVRAVDTHAEILADHGGRQHLVEVKSISEGRRDRLIPLLAQVILQSKIAAEGCPAPTVPVAVVASGRVPISVADEAIQFALHHAPGVGAGVVDAEGLRVFAGHGLERFNASPSRRVMASAAPRAKPPRLFSDLNQWMLKVLLGQALQPSLLRIPRGKFQNASQLAAAANVSTMSAFRLLQRLTAEGFLDTGRGALGLVRIDELLERWVSANREAYSETPVRWIIQRSTEHLYASLAEHSSVDPITPDRTGSRKDLVMSERLRCCLGLFAAADVLGFGFVRGVKPHIWMDRLDLEALERFGLTPCDSPSPPDAYVRVPANREAVLRAATAANGVAVSDVLQTWLDVSAHPARGRAQADFIRHRALGPLLS